MLTKPTTTQLRAILAAQSTGTWNGIDQLIEAELAAVHERLVGSREDGDLHRMQGRAQALRELRAVASDARQTLEAMERPNRKPA